MRPCRRPSHCGPDPRCSRSSWRARVPDFLPALELQGGLHVEFFQAIPVSEPEVAFKRKHDAEALLRRWEEADVHFWDSDRRLESAGDR